MSRAFRGALLAVVSALVWSPSGLGPAAANAATVPRTATVGIEFDPPCLNAMIDTCNIASVRWITGPALSGAYRLRPDFTFEPVLVERVDVQASPFALTYRIKPEAVWSDGTPVSADDFLFTLETVRDPANATTIARAAYERVSAAERIDAKTFRLLFSRPQPDWKSLFPTVLPKHVLEGRDFDEVWRDGIVDPATQQPIGSGPFLLTSRVAGQSLTITRNPRWWGRHPMLDSIVFRAVLPNDQLQAIRDGSLDLVFPQPQPGLAEIGGLGGLALEWAQGTAVEHIDVNVASAAMPLLREAWFRRALAYSLDRDAASASAYETLIPSYPALQNLSYLPVQAEYEPTFAGYSFDPQAVSEIMLAQGCVTGSDGIWSCGGVRASVKLATVQGNALREQLQALLIPRAREAGIELVPDNSPPSVLFGTRLPARDYELIWFSSGNSVGRSPWLFYGCGGSANTLEYCSPAVDDFLLRAEEATDLAAKGQLVNHGYRLLAVDVPTIPLFARPVFLVRRNTLLGPVLNPEGNATWNVEVWRLGRHGR